MNENSAPIVCEWGEQSGSLFNPRSRGLFEEGMRVVVDETAGTVTFEYCFQRRSFWSVRREEKFTCRIDEILAVFVEWRCFAYSNGLFRRRVNAAISTLAGKAIINSHMSGYDRVIEALRRHIGPNHGPMIDNPNAWYVGIVFMAVFLMAVLLFLAFR